MAGWAAGALLPIAQLVQPLRLLTWQDTLPSGRDLEAAVSSALQVGRPQMASRPAGGWHSSCRRLHNHVCAMPVPVQLHRQTEQCA
jgi:hypothetical protein